MPVVNTLDAVANTIGVTAGDLWRATADLQSHSTHVPLSLSFLLHIVVVARELPLLVSSRTFVMAH